MKTNNRETLESPSTLILAMLTVMAISVISAIFVVLLTVDSKQNEEQMQSLGRMPPILIERGKKPVNGPVGGPYIPSTDARPTSNSLDSVDRALGSMIWANIAFNAPQKVSLADKAQIQLLLSIHESMDELRGLIVAAGNKEGATIKVSNQMEARLTGQEGSFKILKITPEEQAVGSIGTFEWKWEVEPLIPGVHTLYLSLIAHFSVDGVPTRKSIRTFERKIKVEVSAGQWALQFYQKNWQWLWTTILVPVAVLLWTQRRRLWKGQRVGRKK